MNNNRQTSFQIPEFTTLKQLFSLELHNKAIRRLNAVSNMRASAGAQPGPLMIADGVNSVLPVSGSGTATGSSVVTMNYRGTYDNTLAYAVGDVVRVKGGGYPLGVWICVVAQSASGSAPAWPEPADSGGTNNWELLSIGPKQYTGYSGGANKTFTIQMFES